ncbi:MAG: hypothetical protein LBG04_02125 [Holosporaceae bacterium]|nr:hypothetical protein [Holosporaceae bacterium]
MKLKKYCYAIALLLYYSPDGNCMKPESMPTGGSSCESLRTSLLEQEGVLDTLLKSTSKEASDVIVLSIKCGNTNGACDMLNELDGRLSISSHDLVTVLKCEQIHSSIRILHILTGALTPKAFKDIHDMLSNLECLIVQKDSPVNSVWFEQDETLSTKKWLHYTIVRAAQLSQIDQPKTLRQSCCNVY